MEISPDRIQEIRNLSFEADNFLQSNLCKAVKDTLEKTKADIINRLFNNTRLDSEKELTREQFVERLSAQYQTLYATIAIIMQIAQQVKELEKIQAQEKEEKEKDVRSAEGKHPSHG